MKHWLLFIIFPIFFLFCALVTISKIKKHYKSTNGVINYDGMMRKFIYKVPISKADIIDAINTPNLADELQCSINFEKSTIAFSSYDVMQGEYYFDIQEHDGFSILRLESVTSILFKNELACKINPFIIRKLNAQAIPYTQYNSYPL